jgi:hypothetical protein
MLRAWAKGDGVASLTRALLALVMSLCAGAAGSQTLPFVEPGGLMQAELRYSQVVARLGEPSRSREKWMSGDPALEGGIVFEYPAQGLGFVVPADERPRPDPRVAYVLVRAPATARTPEGIGIGMPLAAVRPLISAGDARPEGGMLAWTGSPGAGTRRAQLHFGSAQTLELMVFDAGLARAGAMADWIKKVRVALAGVRSWRRCWRCRGCSRTRPRTQGGACARGRRCAGRSAGACGWRPPCWCCWAAW